MKKFLGSLLGGFVIGLPLSFWWIGYEDITYSQLNLAGAEEVIVREMDFDFVFYASLIIIAIATVIYLVWSKVHKRREEQFYRDYRNNSK